MVCQKGPLSADRPPIRAKGRRVELLLVRSLPVLLALATAVALAFGHWTEIKIILIKNSFAAHRVHSMQDLWSELFGGQRLQERLFKERCMQFLEQVKPVIESQTEPDAVPRVVGAWYYVARARYFLFPVLIDDSRSGAFASDALVLIFPPLRPEDISLSGGDLQILHSLDDSFFLARFGP